LQSFVDVVDRAIMAEIPAISDDPVLAGDLHLSTRHRWMSFLSMLGHPEHRLVLPPRAVDLAHSLARHRLDVGVLLKVYLAAHRGVFEHLGDVMDRLGEEEPTCDEVLRFLWSRVDLWMEGSVEALIESFYEERQRLHEGAVARRAEIIDTLLGGEEVTAEEVTAEEVTAEEVTATSVIPYRSGRPRTSSGPRSRTAPSGSAPRHRTSRGRSVAGRPSPRPWAQGTCGVGPPPPARATTATSRSWPPPWTIGTCTSRSTSPPAASRASIGRREARAAQHVVLQARTTPRIVRDRDVELLCLAMERRDLLEGMIQREVGPPRGEDGTDLAHGRGRLRTCSAVLAWRTATASRLQDFSGVLTSGGARRTRTPTPCLQRRP
jgi:hypothetical protein